jgi:hypothetical protein
LILNKVSFSTLAIACMAEHNACQALQLLHHQRMQEAGGAQACCPQDLRGSYWYV